jgi:hypothetical protein
MTIGGSQHDEKLVHPPRKSAGNDMRDQIGSFWTATSDQIVKGFHGNNCAQSNTHKFKRRPDLCSI